MEVHDIMRMKWALNNQLQLQTCLSYEQQQSYYIDNQFLLINLYVDTF